MIIGVDCDGVLTDLNAYICKYGEKWFKRKPINPNAKEATEAFGCTKDEEFKFGLRYFFPYCRSFPPREGAIDALDKLGKNNQIYSITARMFTTRKNLIGEYSRHLFRHWIKNNNFNFEKVYFCSEKATEKSKYRACKKYSVDVMIDDSPEIALYIAQKGIKVLLFDTGYNKEVVHENITRVYSWEDITQKIERIEQQEKNT